MSFEVLPPIAIADLSALKLERLTADVEDEAIDKALADLAERNVAFQPEEGRDAAEGDMVTMDFVGRIDGETFDGGSAEGASLVIGKKQFIPGFEEGLVGVKAGDERVVQGDVPRRVSGESARGKSGRIQRDGEGGCEAVET